MAITRWTSVPTLRDLGGFQDDVSHLFDQFYGRPLTAALAGDTHPAFTPAVDIQESPEDFILNVDLPGVTQKDVKVSLTGDTLTIRGERKLETVQQQGAMHRIERLYGTFERSFTLGAPVRNDKIKATYKDGVLEVRIPKAEEARLREIEVQVG